MVPLSHTFTGYVDDLVNHGISDATRQIFGTMDVFVFAETPDILAAVLCVVMIVVKTGGVHSSSKINNFFTVFNMSVLGFVIVFGFYLADITNWTDDFMPFGIAGFLKGNIAEKLGLWITDNRFFWFVLFVTILNPVSLLSCEIQS
jgi:amino acid transporter